MSTMEERALELIHNSGLSRIADSLTSLLMYSIRLKIHSVQESELAIGASKIGGTPDLPPGMMWPEWKEDEPFLFIAQINLSEIAAYDREGALPHTGMLYFLYYEGDEWYFFIPKKQGDPTPWHVIYYDGDLTQLQRAPLPSSSSPDWMLFSACAVEFSTELTLPPFESPYIERLGLSYTAYAPGGTGREDVDRYHALDEQMHSLYDDGLTHRLLGHPDPVQGDMLLECQLHSHALDWKDYADKKLHDAELEAGATDWRLLLQIDSDDTAKMMWGDVGMIYFWIRREDLERRDFSHTWLVMQCC
jgi:uncharacterized protein YwqG